MVPDVSAAICAERFPTSIDKAKKLLGYNPQTEFETGLRKVYDWIIENRENIERDAKF